MPRRSLGLTPEAMKARVKQQAVKHSMALQERRKAEGKCVKCSTIAKPTYALEGHTCCSACLERMVEYAKYGKEEPE